MKEPGYYNKYRKYCPGQIGEEEFLSYLEQLNQIDWTDFIEDIVSKKSWILTIAQPLAETNLLSYFAEFFDKLGSTSNRLLREALNSLAYRFIAEPRSQKRKVILIGTIKLSKILGWGISKDILALSFVTGSKVLDDIRELSAITLALYDDPPPIDFWTNEIRLSDYPFLAYPKILALHDVHPAEGLSIYQHLNRAPSNKGNLRVPTIKAIRNLLSNKDGLRDLHEKLGCVKTWAHAYIYGEILDLNEFKKRRIKEGLQKLEQQARRNSLQVPKQPTSDERLPDPFTDVDGFGDILGLNGNNPTRLKSPLSTIPDHMLPWIALKEGFLGWFNVGLEDPSENPAVSHLMFPHAHKELFNSRDAVGDVLIAEPRAFLSDTTPNSIDVAVTNIFKGFAIIGLKKENLIPFDATSPDSFWDLFKQLHEKGSRIGVIDDGGDKLVEYLREIIRSRTKVSGNIYADRINLKSDRDTLIEHIESNKIDFMIGPVTSKVLARQKQMVTYFELESLSLVVKKIADPTIKKYWITRLNELKKYTLHNCWNLNLSYKSLRGFRIPELIPRLASAAFFTIDYVNNNTTKIVNRIADMWNENHKSEYHLDSKILDEEFRTSYRFIGFDDCEKILFNKESDYCYEKSLNFYLHGVGQKDKTHFKQIFHNLEELRQSYNKEAGIYLRLLKNKTETNGSLRKSKDFFQKAQCYSKIRNYYDAAFFAKEAVKLLRSA